MRRKPALLLVVLLLAGAAPPAGAGPLSLDVVVGSDGRMTLHPVGLPPGTKFRFRSPAAAQGGGFWVTVAYLDSDGNPEAERLYVPLPLAGSDPGPVPPTPTPTGLAARVAGWAKAVPLATRQADAKALCAAARGVTAKIKAGTLSTPEAIEAAYKAANRGVLDAAAYEAWRTAVFAPLAAWWTSEVTRLGREMTASEYAATIEQVASGLEAVK